jgi:hypothetical protein
MLFISLVLSTVGKISRELQELGFSDRARTEILKDIFGHQEGNTFSEGLVDSTDEDDFDKKLEIAKGHWAELETSDGAKSGFYSWFVQHKVNSMKATMLKTVRAEAGLGSPPQPFTTNASETTNSVIKAHVRYAHSQLLMEFVNHLKDVVDEQERELERAIIKRGKFRFKEEYSHLEVEESQWFSMTPQQRQIHMKKVASARVGKKSANVTCPQSLPVDVSDVAASTNLPLPCPQGIWSKATELLQAPGSIVAAPGHPANTWMVASRSGQRPHLVVPCKGGLIK